LRFDDLAAERVTLIDIETALKTESPYLLFYQILPIDQDASMANLSYKALSSRASDATLDGDMNEISRKLFGLAVDDTDGSTAGDVTSARPSFEITAPDNGDVPNVVRRPSIVFSEGASGHQARSAPSMSPRLAPMEEESARGTFGFSRRGSRAKSNSGSRAGSQSGDNRIGSTFSRFTGRLSRDKFTSDGEGEADESALEADDASPDDMKLGPAAYEGKEKSRRGRTKDRGSKGKSKEKSKEKTRKPERECVVM
jgi:hypothetical protein